MFNCESCEKTDFLAKKLIINVLRYFFREQICVCSHFYLQFNLLFQFFYDKILEFSIFPNFHSISFPNSFHFDNLFLVVHVFCLFTTITGTFFLSLLVGRFQFIQCRRSEARHDEIKSFCSLLVYRLCNNNKNSRTKNLSMEKK